jgi:hypothetical protein
MRIQEQYSPLRLCSRMKCLSITQVAVNLFDSCLIQAADAFEPQSKRRNYV